MSKDTFVKASAQGGGSGSGGPPGTWTILGSGTTPIPAGATVTLATVATPAPGEALMIVASSDGAAAHVYPGSTTSAPPTTAVVYDQVTAGINTDVVARGGGGIGGSFNLLWAVYKVVFP